MPLSPAVGRTLLGLLLMLTAACGGGLRPLPPAAAPVPVVARPSEAATSVAARPASVGTLTDGVSETDLDALWSRQLLLPVEGLGLENVRNDFDAKRGSRSHRALDFMAPKGTAVLAADDGRIGRIDTTPLGGRIIYASDSDERFVYYYAHLDAPAPSLRVGDVVRKGELIGFVGTTGNAPANVPHLHFQVMRRGSGRAWWDGPPINPWGFFTQVSSTFRQQSR